MQVVGEQEIWPTPGEYFSDVLAGDEELAAGIQVSLEGRAVVVVRSPNQGTAQITAPAVYWVKMPAGTGPRSPVSQTS
jgi:hypothetical protein